MALLEERLARQHIWFEAEKHWATHATSSQSSQIESLDVDAVFDSEESHLNIWESPLWDENRTFLGYS